MVIGLQLEHESVSPSLSIRIVLPFFSADGIYEEASMMLAISFSTGATFKLFKVLIKTRSGLGALSIDMFFIVATMSSTVNIVSGFAWLTSSYLPLVRLFVCSNVDRKKSSSFLQSI